MSEKETSQNGTGCVRNSCVSSAPARDRKSSQNLRRSLPAFSLVMVVDPGCSSVSKIYSSVPPSLAGPRYWYSSIDIAGRASERAITIAARYRMVHHRKNPSARSIALFSSWNRVCVIRPLQCQGFTVRNPPTFPDCLHQLVERNPSVLDRLTHSGPSPLPLPGQLSS